MAVSTFDASFYRAVNPDLAQLSESALVQHFYQGGLNEGRRFSAFVDLGFYRAANPDLAGLNQVQLFNHLERAGVAEGRRISPFVDVNFYLAAHRDLTQAFGQNREAAFNHLLARGIAESRAFSPYVDLSFYRLNNADLNQAFSGQERALFNHLVISGLREGRQFSPFVDLGLYLQVNPDVNAAFGGNSSVQGDRLSTLNHLVLAGVNEGRQFSIALDLGYYLQSNPDVAQFAGNNRERAFNHLLLAGLNENRSFAVNYNSQFYRQRYASLLRNVSNQDLLSFWLRVGLPLNDEATPDPGGTPSTAYNVGSLNSFSSFSTELIFAGEVAPTDGVDYYRLSVNSPSLVAATVTSLESNAALEVSIQDSSGNTTLISSQAIAGRTSTTSLMVNPGTYLVRIAQAGATETSYLLDLGRTAPLPVGTSGTTVVTAPVLSLLPPARGVIQDRVDNSNSIDFYSLSITAPTTLSATLGGLSGDADLFLYAENEAPIAQSTQAGTRDDFFSAPLQPGLYLLAVNQAFSGDTINYRLTLDLA
jgi:hypothetical protein